MKHARSTMRRPFLVLLVVVMLTVTLGTGLASAANTSTPQGASVSDWMAMCAYRIQPGDTLSGIAVKFGTSVSALASINHIPNPRLIRSGAILWVPCGGGHVLPPPPPPHHVGCACTYRVKTGDTLSAIAVRYGTTVNWLMSVNHLCNPNRIYAGTWLRVPCCDP